MRERSVVRLSVTPSTKCSCSGSPPILANGNTTIERCGGSERPAGGGGLGPETARPAAGFAGVARDVPAPATGAALDPASIRQITVNGEQEVMESGVGQ